MNTTEKKEAIKIIKAQVMTAQEEILKGLVDGLSEGKPATKKQQDAYAKLMKAREKAKAAKEAETAALRAYNDTIGAQTYGYDRDTTFLKDGVLHVSERGNGNIKGIVEGYTGRKKSTPVQVAQMLSGYPVAQESANKVFALQTFVDVEVATDIWLSDTEGAKAMIEGLADRIAEITA